MGPLKRRLGERIIRSLRLESLMREHVARLRDELHPEMRRLDARLEQVQLRTKDVAASALAARQEGATRQQFDEWASIIRNEFTVLPRFGFHQPLDYAQDTLPPKFAPPVEFPGERLPLPPTEIRMGYPADDRTYLEMGRHDHDLIVKIVDQHRKPDGRLDILDFGCSSGRVLRHFDSERREKGWGLYGADLQALPIEWMRRFFPPEFCIFTSNALPHLPLADASVDVVYGISVFTHIKFLWDAWLMELRRILRPGGLLIQSIHTENAWRFYYEHRHESWVPANHSAMMLQTSEMEPDFLYYGDISVSQVFWKSKIAREFWSRYFTVVDFLPPPEFSFQDWMICRKD